MRQKGGSDLQSLDAVAWPSLRRGAPLTFPPPPRAPSPTQPSSPSESGPSRREAGHLSAPVTPVDRLSSPGGCTRARSR
eukprot:1721263-Pyramimonas_sp.AAC.1